MYEKPMPIGEPILFQGEYVYDRVYPLYIQMLTCCFELKEGRLHKLR